MENNIVIIRREERFGQKKEVERSLGKVVYFLRSAE
jgi:hypothetical protein